MKKPKTKKPPPTKTRRRPPAVEVVLERRLDVDVRTRQLPVGDREDDPRFDGRTARALRDLVTRGQDAQAAVDAAIDGDGELGPIVLPSADDSLRVLRALATLYHERHAAARRHDDLRTRTKDAAGVLAALDARIAERIRVATHRTGLPLFAATEGDDLDTEA